MMSTCYLFLLYRRFRFKRDENLGAAAAFYIIKNFLGLASRQLKESQHTSRGFLVWKDAIVRDGEVVGKATFVGLDDNNPKGMGRGELRIYLEEGFEPPKFKKLPKIKGWFRMRKKEDAGRR